MDKAMDLVFLIGYRGTGKIDPYIPYLQTRLAEGCTNQSRLWRELKHQGFTGTRSLVAKWMHAHGQPTPVAPAPAAPQLPAARQLARLLFQDTEKRSAEDQALVLQLQQHTELTHVQQLVQQGTALSAAVMISYCETGTMIRSFSTRGVPVVIENE